MKLPTLFHIAIVGSLIPGASGQTSWKPATYVESSPNGRFMVVIDAERNMTTVYRVSSSLPGPGQTIWRMQGWRRGADISDDGDYLVSTHDGLNLLPLEFSDTETVLTFYRRGTKVRDVKLKEIYPNPRVLLRYLTTVHHLWGIRVGLLWQSRRGWTTNGDYYVETSDGRTIAFDPRTGTAASRR